MANYSYRSVAARASSVLTTAEVAAASLNLDSCFGGDVTVEVTFTIGMLTNVVLRPYVSMDGSTWIQLANPASTAGVVLSQTPTASYTAALSFNCAGYKYFRLTAQGTGTVTNSLLVLNYRHLKVGSQ